MSTPPVHTPTQLDALEALAANQRAVDEAITHLKAAARACHDQGVSYAAMGARLGTSRQAAWERFGRPAPTIDRMPA